VKPGAGPVNEVPRVVVIGGGVAALSAAIHLLELCDADRARALQVDLLAPLLPDRDLEGRITSNGSGLGGKAMARNFEGEFDEKSHYHRTPFYGPMMPHKGTIPHGYHVLWAYPHLCRMLGDTSDFLRPARGSLAIASFMGDLADPTPGGPGVGIMGLCDPATGEAFREETALLFRLRGHDPIVDGVLALVEHLFSALAPGIDPLAFCDLFFAHEIDLELRVALILASIEVRSIDPETATLDGRPLYEVEYREWTRRAFRDRAIQWKPVVTVGGALYDQVDGAIRLARDLFDRSGPPVSPGRDFNVDDDAQRRAAREYVMSGLGRVLEGLPEALGRLAAGKYPAWRSLHFRFAPDATFTSPYSFDAAQAVRSLAFCFTSPTASRVRTADGGQWNKLALKLWQRIDLLAARNPQVKLRFHDSRVSELRADSHTVRVVHGGWTGHSGDLGMPHSPSIDHAYPPPDPARADIHACAVIPTMAPGALEAVLGGRTYESARRSLEPLRVSSNETLELLIWTREKIQWCDHAARALRESAITGLEGPFCLLADYSMGLWSPGAMAEENPFGEARGSFRGSVIESCGGFEETYACLTRDDAFGWPLEAKTAIRDLLSKKSFFATVDGRPWPYDDGRWRGRRAGGTWTRERAMSPEGLADWQVASRWLAWGFLRQLSMIQSLGAQAVRQLAELAGRLDPRGADPLAILEPPADLRRDVRYVVMRNAKPRNRIFAPGVGSWPQRHVSGLPIDAAERIFPAGEWTRNGLDIVCMEAACLSGMRAARGAWQRVVSAVIPPGAPGFDASILPPQQWYAGNDPLARGAPGRRE